MGALTEQLQAAGVEVRHHFQPRQYLKETRIPAGATLVQHKHSHAHLSFLASGTVVLSVDGEAFDLSAPLALAIGAGKHHAVRAITDSVWYCIHETDETDPDVIEQQTTLAADPAQITALLGQLQH
jgi:quercetin dioxygenase-like cupin family protein